MHSLSWRCEHVLQADSTQDLVLARSAEHAGLVVWTADQRSGRGRADRHWISPPGSGVAMSILLKPDSDGPAWTWFSLLLGCAASLAIRDRGVPSSVKWPNDVVVGEHKIAGILATAASDAVVLGIGINTAMTLEQRPESRATSLRLEGASDLEPEALIDDVLSHFAELLDSNDWVDIYRQQCSTLGMKVHVQMPQGDLEGTAVDVADSGELIVRGIHGEVLINVGDITHIR